MKNFLSLMRSQANPNCNPKINLRVTVGVNSSENDKRSKSDTTNLSAPEVKKFVPSGCYEVT